MWIFLAFIVIVLLCRRGRSPKRQDIPSRERRLEQQLAEHRVSLRRMLEAHRAYRAETERIVAAMVREIHAAKALGANSASQSERDLATIQAIKLPNQ